MGLVVALAFSPSLATGAETGHPAGVHVTPYLQQVTETGITVRWETTLPVLGSVEYGQDGRFDQVAAEKDAALLHEVFLTGLRPGETYNYRVLSGGEPLPEATFATAPPKGTETWRFVAYGDNRSNPDTHSRVVEQIIRAKPDIVLTTGDLVARGNQYLLWKREFFDPVAPLSRSVPIFVSLGNHENHAQHYFDYFTFPAPENEQFYSFDYGNAHIVALDSDVDDLEDPEEFEARQMEWMRRDLEEHADATWKIVFFHHPLFNAHPKRSLHALHWQPVLEACGVDLTFSGHDHYYLRNYDIGSFSGQPKRGVRHVITGGGGAGLYPVVERIHAAFRRSIHHIVVIDVQGDRMVGRSVDIDGAVMDAFVLDKQSVAAPEEFIAYEMYQIEDQLKDLIEELPELPADQETVELDTTLELDNPFTVPIKMSVSWNSPDGWVVGPGGDSRILHPGEKIVVPIDAKGPNSAGSVPPHGRLAFARTDGEKAFRNDELLFFPVKLWYDVLFSRMKTSMVSIANKEALMRSTTLIRIPTVDMEGNVLDHRSVSDEYPADGLAFESVRLRGALLDVAFDELSEDGNARLRGTGRMDISFDTATRFVEIELDLRAERLNEKLCVGKFTLVPRSVERELHDNELTVRLGSDTDEEIEVSGWLRVAAYSKAGIAGEFELLSESEDGEDSILHGQFKFPLSLD